MVHKFLRRTSFRLPQTYFGWAWVLVLAAALLRGADIQGRSMWPDEGATYLRIVQSLADNLRNVLYLGKELVIDTQPPFYFLLLKGWGTLAGVDEFSLKWFTVLFGVLVVPLTLSLGRNLFGRRVGLLAGLFMALSPGVQWYSHEVRMYTLVVCLAALSVIVLQRALMLRAQRPGIWVGVFGVWALSVLTHYSFVGLVTSQALFAAVFVLSRWQSVPTSHRRMLITIILVMVITLALLALLPDVQSLLLRLSSGKPEPNYHFVPLDVIFWSELSGFLFGLNAPAPRAWLPNSITWAVGGLCLLGALLPAWRNAVQSKRINRGLLLVSLLAPVLIWFGISLIKPSYQGFRHLMLILPFMAVLLGRLAAVLWQRGLGFKLMGALMTLVIVASQVYGLAYGFIRTPNWHDDFRGVAYYIRDHWQEGDIIVIPAPIQAITVMSYLPGFPWRHYADSTTADAPKTSITDAKRQQTRQMFAHQFRRVWYMPLYDYETGVWFAQDFFHRKKIHFASRNGEIQLDLFEIESPITSQVPTDLRRVTNDIDRGGITLAGYRFVPAARFNPQPNTHLSLYWRRDTNELNKEVLSTLYTTFRMVYGGRPWWNLDLPGELNAAPDNWEPGAFFRVDYVLPLPLGLPELPYELKLDLHQGSKSEIFQTISAPILASDVSCCLRIVQWPIVSIAPSQDVNPTNPLASPLTNPGAAPIITLPSTSVSAAVLSQPAPLAVQWAGWRDAVRNTLSSRDAELVKIEYPDEVRVGEALPVVLTWQANQPRLQPWQTEIRLEPLIGSAIAITHREAGTTDFPVTIWPIHQPVRDDYSLQIPNTLNAGWFKLVLSRQRAGAELDSQILGLLYISFYPTSPIPAIIQHPMPATIGDLALLGWSLNHIPTRDVTLEFHTLWRVDTQPQRDGVLFLHIFAPDSSVAKQPYAQDDNTPEYGKRLTLTYRPGEGLDQLHRVVLPPNAPAGEYRLFAGIYDRNKECCRWPAQQNGQPAKDNLVYLGSFSLPKLPVLAFKHYVPLTMKP